MCSKPDVNYERRMLRQENKKTARYRSNAKYCTALQDEIFNYKETGDFNQRRNE
jgi:hypothetical protein